MASFKISKFGDWTKMRRAMVGLAARNHLAQKKAARQEAQYFRKKVLKAFKTEGRSNGIVWEPNKELTRKNKRSSKALSDRGDLRKSIEVIERGDTIFIGVPSKARSQDGDRLVDIAEVHEFGKTIVVPVTDASFRYFFANIATGGGGAGSGSGSNFRPGGFFIVRIPKRSFLQSTVDAHFQKSEVRRRMNARIAFLLGPPWSTGVGRVP